VGLIGGNPEDVPMVLDLYDFPSLEEQVSARWLGGGPGGGAARALTFTSEFLKAEKKIPTVLDDYSTAINPKWAEAALAGGC
jgi:taurine transport system substrate-binding protein